MKKQTLTLMGSLALSALLSVQVFAVWVPSTSLEEKPPRPTPEQIQRSIQKLQEDERRLEEGLMELRKDHEELERLLGKPDGGLK